MALLKQEKAFDRIENRKSETRKFKFSILSAIIGAIIGAIVTAILASLFSLI